MLRLVQPKKPPEIEVLLNLCCGSGTLVIEHLQSSRPPSGTVIGCDTDPTALGYAQGNSAAAQVHPALLQADAASLPLPAAHVDTLCADLPFGQLSGSHAQNARLYPAVLAEAARVARPDARFVVITHEIRLMEKLLQESAVWKTEQSLKITLNGLHPRIYLLRRAAR
jgi:23S rRNA G2445 N2-methylase RlmL